MKTAIIRRSFCRGALPVVVLGILVLVFMCTSFSSSKFNESDVVPKITNPQHVVSGAVTLPQQNESRFQNVLLTGEYLNQNLGDVAQVISLSLHLKNILPKVKATFFNDRPLKDVMQDDRNNSTKVLRYQEVGSLSLSNFDGLIVGGGGIFASERILRSPFFHQSLSIPYAILACGANSAAQLAATFIDRATFVSARDSYSRNVLQKYTKEKVRLIPDPILADVTNYLPTLFELPKQEAVCYVVRTRNRSFENFFQSIFTTLNKNDRFLGIFPPSDAHWEGFPYIPQLTSSANAVDFIQHIRGCSVVVSFRYHGAILSIKQGIPTVTVSFRSKYSPSSKLESLFVETLQIPQGIIRMYDGVNISRENIQDTGRNIPWNLLGRRLLDLREDFVEGLETLAKRIGLLSSSEIL